jgi:DNA anti-recombination protein RmuC
VKEVYNLGLNCHSATLNDVSLFIRLKIQKRLSLYILLSSFLMVGAVVTSVLEEALRQASERIAKKITEGKRLTSIDVIILLLDQMNKRMEVMNESLNRRIDDTNKRIDDLNTSLNKRIDDTNKRIDDTNKRIDDIKEDLRLLHQEVSSIKSDVIALMREKLKTG